MPHIDEQELEELRRKERKAKQRRWHFTEPRPGKWDGVAPEIREMDRHQARTRHS